MCWVGLLRTGTITPASNNKTCESDRLKRGLKLVPSAIESTATLCRQVLQAAHVRIVPVFYMR